LVRSQCSREIEIIGPIDPASLIVQARAQTKSDRRSTLDAGDWDKEAAIKLKVVCRDRINLVSGVTPSQETVGASARTLAADN